MSHKSTLRLKLEQLGWDKRSIDRAVMYQINHKTLTDEDVIEYYTQPKELPFSVKCRQAGVNYESARRYKLAHRELTDKQVIEYYLSGKNINLSEKCRRAGIY